MRQLLLSTAVVSLLTFPAAAERVDPIFVRDAIGIMTARGAAPPLIARQAAEPIVTLGAASVTVPEEVAAILEWNERGGRPARNGFTRSIGEPIRILLAPNSRSTASPGSVLASDRDVAWGGSMRVAAAHRLRVHLKNVLVPPEATFWVYGRNGSPISFGTELIDQRGEIYTPSVDGDTAYLEVEIPGAATAYFEIRDVLELLPPKSHDTPDCLIDATCVSASTLDVIDLYRRAVAYLEFVVDGKGAVCTGGLINDKDPAGFIPYFLTANHCISTPAQATSLEAFWDFKTTTCSGAFPSPASMPRSNGSTLLSTSSKTDFAFLRMTSVPSGRVYLGWDTKSLAPGTTLHRISHPYAAFMTPVPQAYSTSTITSSGPTCSGAARPYFIYSTMDDGGVYGGSSGSPSVLPGGYVVGQLLGACGPTALDDAGCDPANSTIDGAFAQTYPFISGYLGGGTAEACIANSTTACVLNKRFRVKMRYRLGFDNNPPDTDALLKPVTGFGNPNFETVFFYFNSPDNIEAMVKMLDQGNTNGSGQPTIAVLFGTATPLGIEVSITDTLKGGTRTYTSAFGSQRGETDFTAFVK